MSNQELPPLTVNEIREALPAVFDAGQCLALASMADAAGDASLNRLCLEQAITLDRGCQAALINLAALSHEENDPISTFCMLEEASRIAPLPSEVEPLRTQLYEAALTVPELEHYFRLIGRAPAAPAGESRSILVVTGAYPPDATTDSARELAELVRGLQARGHRVRVLASGLQLCGTRVGSKVIPLDDVNERAQRQRNNVECVRTAIVESKPGLVLATDLELLDITLVQPALERGVPVLHWLRSPRPTFSVEEQPVDPHYWIAPISEWTGTSLRNGGYETARMDSVYPPVAIERFFRLFLPETRRLRICLAAPLRPASGAETLIRALIDLQQRGVAFAAEIAGETPDAAFLEKLQTLVREHGLESSVRFTEAVSGEELAGLFARQNVFVAASSLPEPFMVSQVQAMASGLIVVSSGAGGSKEIVRDGTDGLLFAPGNAADLGAKLATLAQDPELMSRLQRQAQARSDAFSLEKAVTKIETLAGEMRAAIDTAQSAEAIA